MIKGIGLDIIEMQRIKKSMARQERFVNRILTENEKKIFNKLLNKRRKIEFLAGRFAAKEAFAKAAGCGIGKLSFQHIEVLHRKNNAPLLRVKGYEADHIFISITHSKDYAAAQVIIEEHN
ncbi:holo-ACP synthase [Virgibacillus alimentarius]|uniref:Holo-[acyl-carrier-protein] synthase n=1 Tax=Virgibacillus alimentarius TaxID=698769 RepID=A0ABS4SD28_9BACI|nr:MULTISPECIES: holo-ACP synthase [Virgibacillus]MBP2258307.1 holo-[acyl-carrier protein] synthase [Virgibacillus alimentarius]HLR67316.1 holo-ACP synthase [Virgibacillus sp.]